MRASQFLLDPLDPDEVYQRLLVNVNSPSVTKRVSLLLKKIPPAVLQKMDLTLPKRFLVTEDVIKKISLSRTQHLPLALVMIEIDQFNEIKEKYNKEEVRQLVDSLMFLFTSLLRKYDFLVPQSEARFLLILPHTSQRAASFLQK